MAPQFPTTFCHYIIQKHFLDTMIQGSMRFVFSNEHQQAHILLLPALGQEELEVLAGRPSQAWLSPWSPHIGNDATKPNCSQPLGSFSNVIAKVAELNQIDAHHIDAKETKSMCQFQCHGAANRQVLCSLHDILDGFTCQDVACLHQDIWRLFL